MRPDLLPAEPGTSSPDSHRARVVLRGPRIGEVMWQTLRLQRRALLLWAVGLTGMVALYGSLWPSLRDQASVTELMDQLPEVVRSLLAVSDMSTPVGYVQAELLGLTGPLLVILFAVLSGSNGVAGEEDRRSLDLLLADPVSRTRVVLERMAAMVVGIAVLVAAIGLALVAAGVLAGLDLPVARVGAAMLHLGLLGSVFGALAAAVGAATGRPAVARAVPAVVAVLAYLVDGLAPLVGWLEPLRGLSPFAQYSDHVPLVNGVSVSGVSIAVGTVAALAAAAALTFRRRDVAG
ncbi:ABC transporter permease [Blastococcus sp. URHD0036]|uniref:ABC transporter permease n=1 Tax=Blastococcus sp. URHD0036 TaxID=1380356 RepID=UPI0009DDB947|nr:ABC transporter permease [Blastococcus sp. URHD0036]